MKTKPEAIHKIYIKKNWQRIFFAVVGLVLLAFSFYRLWQDDLTGASSTFVMAFISFIFSNLERFKRFKGMGFEAELWEDKKREADQLIERLKTVVTIYTNEIILGKVKEGRWGDGNGRWSECWSLYDRLIKEHEGFDQNIDFSNLKSKMDEYFIFDMVHRVYEPVREAIHQGRVRAMGAIQEEYGSPIRDPEGFSNRRKQLSEVKGNLEDMFGIAQNGDLAAHVLEWANLSKSILLEKFDIEINFDKRSIEKLENISRAYSDRPITVTDELIGYTEKN